MNNQTSLPLIVGDKLESSPFIMYKQTFRRIVLNDPSQAEELPDPPRHIKKTEVLLTTPVRPPAPTDYMKNLKDEEIANAWEEHFNDEHQIPYWANNLTNETTWHKPKCLNAIEARAESRCELNSPLIVVKMINHCLNIVCSSYNYSFPIEVFGRRASAKISKGLIGTILKQVCFYQSGLMLWQYICGS